LKFYLKLIKFDCSYNAELAIVTLIVHKLVSSYLKAVSVTLKCDNSAGHEI